MDYIRAKNTEDAVILGLIIAAAVFLSQTLNNTAVIIFQEKFSTKHKVRDWILYSIVVFFLFVIFIYILRRLYIGKPSNGSEDNNDNVIYNYEI
jgi:hypothetical protein